MTRIKVMWKNNSQQYGLVSKLLHWLSALSVLVLFASGYWMVDLDYSSEWYIRAPHWHESLGVLIIIVSLFRLFWRRVSGKPDVIPSHKPFEVKGSSIVVFLLYLTLFSVLISGFVITSANEQAIAVFNWFNITPLLLPIKNQEDIAGELHEYLAYWLIFFVAVHALGALKHHFIDKDPTLKRMIK